MAASLALAAGAQGPDPGEAAARAQSAGQFQRAIGLYEAYLGTHPARPDVLANLGACYAHLGRFGQAEAEYERALKIAPKYPPALLNLALAYLKTGDTELALPLLRSYHGVAPDDSRGTLLLANSELEMGHYAQAAALAGPLAARDSSNLAAAYVLGTAEIKSGDLTAGEVEINRIMARGDTPVVHLMLGDAYSANHKLTDAAAEYSKAVAMAPKLPLAHQRLAVAQLLSGDSASAFGNFQKEYALNPTSFITNFYLGYLYRQRGDLSQASFYLRRAIAMSPSAFQPKLQLALAEFAANHLQAAQKLLETALKIDPANVQGHVVLGQIDFRLNEPEAGRAQQALLRQLVAKQQAGAVAKSKTESAGLTPLPTTPSGPK